MSTQALKQALQKTEESEGTGGLVLSSDFVKSIFQLPALSFSSSPFFPGFHYDWLTLPSKHSSFWVKLSWRLPVPYAGGASVCTNDGSNATIAWRCHVSVVLALVKSRVAALCPTVADSLPMCLHAHSWRSSRCCSPGCSGTSPSWPACEISPWASYYTTT